MSAPAPVPFTVAVPDEVLADLRERLARTRWPDEAPGSGWRYGTDLGYVLYWATGAINASFWPYWENRHTPWRPSPDDPITAPTGYADFPRELVRPPRALVERAFYVRRWTTMQAGGHFAALEEPEALVEDIRAFFRDLR